MLPIPYAPYCRMRTGSAHFSIKVLRRAGLCGCPGDSQPPLGAEDRPLPSSLTTRPANFKAARPIGSDVQATVRRLTTCSTVCDICLAPLEAAMADNKERWLELCKLAETEQDSGKLIAFVDEINRLLEESNCVNQRDTNRACRS